MAHPGWSIMTMTTIGKMNPTLEFISFTFRIWFRFVWDWRCMKPSEEIQWDASFYCNITKSLSYLFDPDCSNVDKERWYGSEPSLVWIARNLKGNDSGKIRGQSWFDQSIYEIAPFYFATVCVNWIIFMRRIREPGFSGLKSDIDKRMDHIPKSLGNLKFSLLVSVLRNLVHKCLKNLRLKTDP